ncbi:MAG: hypothetical protein RLP44_20160 [Aggregatilineales bacterium]
MYTIATVDALRARLNLDAGVDDTRLRTVLEVATVILERLTARRFQPRLATLTHSVDPLNVLELILDDDLLNLTALTNGDGSALDTDDVLLLPDDDSPAGVLKLVNGQVFVWQNSTLNAVSVGGVWGWHDRPSSMWRDSGDTVQDAPLNASATSLTVTDSAASDTSGESPRFQVGQLLNIEDEFLRVIGVTETTLTVIRGVQGSIPASHAQTTVIFTYQPPQDVKHLCVRLAAWLYKEPDVRGAGGLPPMIRAEIDLLRRVRVR